MAAVGYEGSVGPQRRIVEVGGGAPVVDGEDETGIERRGSGSGPGVEQQADFSGLTLGQRDAQSERRDSRSGVEGSPGSSTSAPS